MKKLIGMFVLLFGVAVVSHAQPLDQGTGSPLQGPYSNTTIWASTAVLSGNSGSIVIPSLTKNSYSCRNCMTKLFLQLSSGSTAYVLDQGTTNYYIYGSGIGAQTVNTIVLTDDHLSPICAAQGDSLTVNLPAPLTATASNSATVEGYTFCGYSNNAGQ